MTELTTDSFGAEIRDQVVTVGNGFKQPDDDWLPMLWIETQDDMVLMPVPLELFDSAAHKDMLVYAIGSILKANKAKRYALLLNGWTIKIDRREGETIEQAQERFHAIHDEWTGHYDQHPNRGEVLSLHVGDRQKLETWTCEIQRTAGAPPTLTPWEQASADDGRFAQIGLMLQQLDDEEMQMNDDDLERRNQEALESHDRTSEQGPPDDEDVQEPGREGEDNDDT